MGHLEACAAAGGLASLAISTLYAGTVSANAQLCRPVSYARTASIALSISCRLNAHISTLVVSARSFKMAMEVESFAHAILSDDR